MEATAAEIAGWLGGQVEGDGSVRVVGVRGLAEADAHHVSFLANRRYVGLFRTSRAGVVLVGLHQKAFGRTVIRMEDPYLGFARVLERFHPPEVRSPGVHPAAVVEGAVDGATVMAFAYVGPGATVGAGTVLHPHSYVGARATVGRDCVLMAGAVLADGCVLGDRVVLNPGVVVGGEGFGFVSTATGHVKIPQTGRVVVEDDVEIGANSNVDRAAVGETRIGRGTKIDNLVQVGHGSEVGSHCLLVAFAGVAGSTRLGDGVVLAARAGVLGHLEVGAGTQVGAYALLTTDTPPGARRSGIPAIEHRRWLRVAASLPELPDVEARLRRVETLAKKPENS